MTCQCPVCGYRAMPYPAVPYNICPCCGTEFGVDDRSQTIPQLRQSWIAHGMPWFDDITSPPSNWSPVRQLIAAEVGADLIEVTGHKITTVQKSLVAERPALWWGEVKRNKRTHRGVTYAEVAGIAAL